MTGPSSSGRPGMADEDPDEDETLDTTRAFEDSDPLRGNVDEKPAPIPDPARDAPKIKGVTVQGVIGKGGQGMVYSGLQDFISRKVAIKVLLKGASEDYQNRFRREARILAGLQHPHIVTCYHADVTELGECYLLMELIEGPDLDRYIRKFGPLDPCDALQVVHDIATALEHGCKTSIIHRDVKPQNVLLHPQVEEGPFPYRAKLADLGLARVTDESSDFSKLTMQGAVMGTPSTMAPEQFDDPESVDFRADIYGLGCVLYQTLAGRLPFAGQTFSQIFKQKVVGELPDLREECSDLPDSVYRLVMRMLDPDRENRQQSYAELIEELDAEITCLLYTSPSPRD